MTIMSIERTASAMISGQVFDHNSRIAIGTTNSVFETPQFEMNYPLHSPNKSFESIKIMNLKKEDIDPDIPHTSDALMRRVTALMTTVCIRVHNAAIRKLIRIAQTSDVPMLAKPAELLKHIASKKLRDYYAVSGMPPIIDKYWGDLFSGISPHDNWLYFSWDVRISDYIFLYADNPTPSIATALLSHVRCVEDGEDHVSLEVLMGCKIHKPVAIFRLK